MPVRNKIGPVVQTGSGNINVASAGNNTIVAGVAGYQIVVHQYKIITSGAVTVTWESSGGRILDGPCAFAANSGEAQAYSDHGHFFTDTGEGLVLDLSAPVQVGGHLVYSLVKG